MMMTFVTKCPCCGTRVSLEIVPASLTPIMPTAAAVVPLGVTAAADTDSANTVVFTITNAGQR